MTYLRCATSLKMFAALALAVALTLIGAAATSQAQTVNTVFQFPYYPQNQPYNPTGLLAQGRDGNLYGTTYGYYDNGQTSGSIYGMSPSGGLSVVYVLPLSGVDGYECKWGLTLGRDGNFYGTCPVSPGGPYACTGGYGCGLAFSVTPAGAFTVLHYFTGGADGANPTGTLTQGSDGNFYGTTYAGGANLVGTVFKITPAGALTTIYSFKGGAFNDGQAPTGPLALGTDGNFYGTTQSGGTTGSGVVYKITSKGKVAILKSFTGSDGQYPAAGVIQGSDGSFYGTTEQGGANTYGTVFKVTAARKYTLLHSFDLTADFGIFPDWPLVQATDGNFYGVAPSCTSSCANSGALFKITSKGVFTVVYQAPSYVSILDSPLLAHTNGLLYGSNYQDPSIPDNGTVFSLNVGLGSFVSAQTNVGKVGTTVNILGQGFLGATNVSFNGTTATFSVVSDGFLTATIPTGATSGYITVNTSSGTLKSNRKFTVKP